MLDLFGQVIEQPKEKTIKEQYQDYIASAQWKRLRQDKIDSVNGKCELCGISKFSVRLEVHHLHYKTFKQERLSDLQALCPKCHEYADILRQTLTDLEKKAHQQQSSLYIGFIEWMKRGNDYEKDMSMNKLYSAREKFLYMLYSRQGKAYSLDLRVFGYRDEYPNWKPGD